MSKIVCAYCERSITVNRDGKVRKHGKCFGSGRSEAGFQRAPSCEPEDPPRRSGSAPPANLEKP